MVREMCWKKKLAKEAEEGGYLSKAKNAFKKRAKEGPKPPKKTKKENQEKKPEEKAKKGG